MQNDSVHLAVQLVEPESRLEFTDKRGRNHSITKEHATKLLKEYLDAWPGGLDEIESSINGWRQRALAAECVDGAKRTEHCNV